MNHDLDIVCDHCGAVKTKSRKARFCGDKCRSQYWSRRLKDAERDRREAVALREQMEVYRREMRDMVEKILELLSGPAKG